MALPVLAAGPTLTPPHRVLEEDMPEPPGLRTVGPAGRACGPGMPCVCVGAVGALALECEMPPPKDPAQDPAQDPADRGGTLLLVGQDPRGQDPRRLGRGRHKDCRALVDTVELGRHHRGHIEAPRGS